jgi:hypothetical protein
MGQDLQQHNQILILTLLLFELSQIECEELNQRHSYSWIAGVHEPQGIIDKRLENRLQFLWVESL